MSQNAKLVFEARPEYLKTHFLDHIQHSLPNSWFYITHDSPPPDGIEVILQDFVVSRKAIGEHGYAPCPICSPVKPKYVKGHLLWSSESGGLYAVGHCCGHGFFTGDTLARALTRNSNAERRRNAEKFVEANWALPRELVDCWIKLQPSVRDLDRVLKAIRVGLRATVCRDIHRTTRDGGFLKIQERVGTVRTKEAEGLTSAERLFGSKAIVGASILRGGNKGISVEAKLSNVTAVLSGLNWATENDAILWICEQVDGDLLLLESLMRDAVENMSAALADIQALLSFLDDGNLQLINDWSLEAHGRQGSVSIHNEDGEITIMRGRKRHHHFKVPATLTQPLPQAPAVIGV